MLYLDFLNLINDKIISTDIDTHPFPHLVFKLDYDTLDFSNHSLEQMTTASGRKIINFKIGQDHDVDSVLSLIGDSIKNKFNISIPTTNEPNQIIKFTRYSEMWEDSDLLDIQEIHLDYLLKNNLKHEGYPIKPSEINDKTQTVYSMHIYTPDDNEHEELGTSLYSTPSYEDVKNTIKNRRVTEDNYMSIICSPCDPPININAMILKHCEKLMIKEKTIPYKPGYVFIHETTPHSWHSAPKVPAGYIRKSIMTRWDYTVMNLVK